MGALTRPAPLPTRYGDRVVTPILRAQRAARTRDRKTWTPLRRARRLAPSLNHGKPTPKPGDCTKPDKPAARDALTGWFTYVCPTGVLLKPAPACVPPECRGGSIKHMPTLGYAGDLDAGSKGSFAQAGRLAGLMAYDGVEIAKGLSQIEKLRQDGEIDSYYAAAAKRAFAEKLEAGQERAAPFQEPAALGAPLAPGALGRVQRVGEHADVGPTVTEACRCTPRKEDARDPVSGWLIYYVPGGVLLTPTAKCIGYYGKPRGFWDHIWHNVVSLVRPAPPTPPIPELRPGAPTVPASPNAPPEPPAPPKGYLCLDPRIWPGAFRHQEGPCVAPQIEYQGP